MTKKQQKNNVKSQGNSFGYVYDETISMLGRLLDNFSWLLGKLFKPLLFTLEAIGIFYFLNLLSLYQVGLDLIAKGNIETGKAYIDAVTTIANTSNSIALAIGVALPSFLGTLRLVKRKISS
jgi:hypothetical protein